jgi:hypothetical protein
LIDFQKNIYAEHFIKEFAKLDPKVLKKYGFEKFLKRTFGGLEGYKQNALNILIAYIDKRKQILGALGVSQEAYKSKREITI